MMGPGFGNEIGKSLIWLGVALLLVGALLGGGCQVGCSWVSKHVNVEVTP